MDAAPRAAPSEAGALHHAGPRSHERAGRGEGGAAAVMVAIYALEGEPTYLRFDRDVGREVDMSGAQGMHWDQWGVVAIIDCPPTARLHEDRVRPTHSLYVEGRRYSAQNVVYGDASPVPIVWVRPLPEALAP